MSTQYFIDLMNERHFQLQKLMERRWNETSDIYISNSEWIILEKIYKKTPTISNVTKQIDISRQATHKFIKNLESKGLLEINSLQQNKKDKCVQLTKLGEQCYEQHELLMKKIEDKMSEKIGHDKYKILKELLKSDWGI